MCGIFGYVGKDNAKKIVVNGLKRLEYRGYDSWGIAISKNNEIKIHKQVGKIDTDVDLSDLPESNIGVGHTRWATHGGVTDINAHPHYSTDHSFVLAQNGIVQNYAALKAELLNKGYEFHSETDTEVIVRLIEDVQKENELSLFDAVLAAFKMLEGRNTIILLDCRNNEIIAARNGSPLIVGYDPKEEAYFFSSDSLSFANLGSKMIVLENNQLVHFVDGKLTIYDIDTGVELEREYEEVNILNDKVDKEGYDHFMLKEIVEQRNTIQEAVHYSEKELESLMEAIKNAGQVYTVGAGTAGYAAAQIAFYLRKVAGIKTIELKAYEVGSYREIFNSDDLIIAVSQSGETADTIEALEFAKAKGTKVASVVNMSGSTISRMSDFEFYSRCGPEICVASTKAFTAQVAWGLLLSFSLIGKHDTAIELINTLTDNLATYFNPDLFFNIQNVVQHFRKPEHFFILGRGQNYYIALEGALKIKEISYKHFEGFASGELKHGVIALIEEGTPVIALVSEEDKADLLNAVVQVKARGAWVVGIGKDNDPLFDSFIPTVDGGIADPLANVIPLQLISYFLGVALDRDPDKPRNLAKSVTVK